MSTTVEDTATVDAVKRTEVEAVVDDKGNVVVPASELTSLGLVPGQRVHLTVLPVRHRKNMRGILAGKLPDVPLEEFEESSRETWGGSARD